MIVPYLTPSNAYYFLMVVFTMSGLSKFGPTGELNKMFPRLPNWFWRVGGTWELVLVVLLRFQYTEASLLMMCVFLGGVLGSCGLLKDLTNKTMVQKSYGAMLLPVSARSNSLRH
jgi:hypothetical protein